MRQNKLGRDPLMCNTCGNVKPLSEFYFTRTTGRYQTQCKDCKKEYNKRRISSMEPSDVKRARKDARLKHKFGISAKQYDIINSEQGGLCAICGKEEETIDWYGERSLAVDHNHDTGKIRGLLCYKCNVSLGWFNDRPDTIRAAIRYLTSGVFLTPVDEIPKTTFLNSRDWRLKKTYGLSQAEYEIMREIQGSSCDICAKRCEGNTLAVDHCHKSGVIRGLLCKGCNTGLGLFGDDTALLETAAIYLERNQK